MARGRARSCRGAVGSGGPLQAAESTATHVAGLTERRLDCSIEANRHNVAGSKQAKIPSSRLTAQLASARAESAPSLHRSGIVIIAQSYAARRIDEQCSRSHAR